MLNDARIRAELVNYILDSAIGLPGRHLLKHELSIGRGMVGGTREADIALISEYMIRIWEIKSDRDDPRRLFEDPEYSQASRFEAVAGQCTLVTTEKHVDFCVGALPFYWGVLRVGIDCLTKKIAFTQIQAASILRSLPGREGVREAVPDLNTLLRLLTVGEMSWLCRQKKIKPAGKTHESLCRALLSYEIDPVTPVQIRRILLNRQWHSETRPGYVAKTLRLGMEATV